MFAFIYIMNSHKPTTQLINLWGLEFLKIKIRKTKSTTKQYPPPTKPQLLGIYTLYCPFYVTFPGELRVY